MSQYSRTIIPQDLIPPTISTAAWRGGWEKMKEYTSSSKSGLHFSHYKSGAQSRTISQFQALKATLLMKRGIVLDRWGRGLSVMIKKMFGCNLVSKLRSILLMEADFSFSNKEILGRRMGSCQRKFSARRIKQQTTGCLSRSYFLTQT